MAVTAQQIAAWATRRVPKFGVPRWADRVLAGAEDAIEYHNAPVFGTNYVAAMGSWVLHWCTILEQEEKIPGGGAAAGPINSIRTGDESVSFAAMASAGVSGSSPDNLYSRTTWGQRYLNYRNSRAGVHSFVI